MNLRRMLLLAVLCIAVYGVGCSKGGDPAPTPTPSPTQPVTLPAISAFAPLTTGPGGTVTITGENLTGATAVTFGGSAAASFTVNSATTITAIVATGTSGEVRVTTANGNAARAGFVFNALAPTITAMSTTTGSTGSIITLTGTNLTGTTAVNFGGSAAASFAVVSNTSLRGVVASGASGQVTVTTPNGAATLPGFIYVAETISAAKLNGTGARSDVGLGFPRKTDRQKAVGTVRTAVIFVDFSDAVATRTPQSAFAIMSPGSENFLKTISNGNLDVVFEPKFKWYRMSKPSSNYGWNGLTFDAHKAYIQEAVSLADAEVDFANIDEIVILSNPDGGSITNGPTFTGSATNGIQADGKTIGNAVTSGRDLLAYREFWFPHEFGHSLGLPDLYGFSGATHRFVGDFSMMGKIGGAAQDFNAWEKWLLGWITDSQVRSVSVNGLGTINLTPVETKEGMKLLVLPIDQTTAVLVEDRRAMGYDQQLSKAGPVVYFLDTKVASGSGVLKVLPISESDVIKASAPLAVGESVTYGNITIKCVASGSNGSTIEYEKK